VATKQQITGTVVRALVAKGSESEGLAVVLRNKAGGQHIFRRVGGNAFRDQALEALVGKTITGTGLLAGQTFIMDKWKTEDEK
jgi:hypothetical protein